MSQPIVLDITGMTCAACAGRVERALRRVEGVVGADVNLALERADVAGSAKTDTLVAAVRAAGFSALARGGSQAERRLTRERLAAERRAHDRRTLVLFLVSAVLTLPFLVEMAGMAIGRHGLLPPVVQFVLATLVQFSAGLRFYRGAFSALRSGGANMDVLVALGTTAAWGFSTAMVWQHGAHAHGHLYFEGAAMVITLVLLGKVLEGRAKAEAAAAVQALLSLRPARARRLFAGREDDVAIEVLAPGDLVVVRPGERVPVDGVVTAGSSDVDEALVTGESHPVPKQPGARVIEGALNGPGLLTVSVTAVGDDTTLARVGRLIEAAQNGRAPVQAMVDRIVRVFVPAVLLIAALTFTGWLLAGGGLEPALVAAVSVLVIACPCALGLATPVTLVAGSGAAARAGILIRDIETLERARAVDTVVFDKTGTLTEGRLSIAAAPDAAVLALAAAVEAGSEHPVARAIVAAVPKPLEPVDSFEAIFGEGVTGRVGERAVAVGNAALMRRLGVAAGPVEAALAEATAVGLSGVMVAIDGEARGLVTLSDQPRDSAAEAVVALKARGAEVEILSGDQRVVAERLGASLGVAAVSAPVSPAGKVERIEALRASGRVVAMVGDGVNDAPALAAADVGIAMGSGTDVALAAAGITLMRPDPRLVAAALDIASATAAKIRQNLGFAFVYNVIGIPLAAFGLLSPTLAGAAMAASSVSVVGNALLLKRWTPPSRDAT